MSCPNQKEFQRQYNLDYAFAKVGQELGNLLDETWLAKAIEATGKELEKAKIQSQVDYSFNPVDKNAKS
jgi:hypothetical protein